MVRFMKQLSGQPKAWSAFGVLAIAIFLAVLDLFIVNIAFPDIRRSFPSSSLPSLSWILSAYAIVFAAVLVPAGKLADIVGRKRVFLAGLLVFLVGSALSAAAPPPARCWAGCWSRPAGAGSS